LCNRFKHSVAVAPVAPPERIVVVDVIRGVALLGILLVNIFFFASPQVYLYMAGVDPWPDPVDRVTVQLVTCFVLYKFLAIFSFLFGLGFTLQMMRVEARGVRFSTLYARRLLILLLMGVAHAVLLSYGDILVPFALCGFLLLLFRRRSDKTIRRFIVILLLIPVAFNALGAVSFELAKLDPEIYEEIEATYAKWREDAMRMVEETTRVFRGADFLQMVSVRIAWMGYYYLGSVFWGPYLLAMFLVGFYIGRLGVFQNLPRYLPIMRGLAWRILPFALLGNFVLSVVFGFAPRFQPLNMLAWAVVAVSAPPSLSFCYVTAITALHARSESWRRRMAPLAAAGRMALTNYIAQSIVCVMIFHGCGLGLYGKLGAVPLMALAFIIFALQVLFSKFWLDKFRFGPLEWVWRSLTYGALQHMRVRSA